MGKTKVVQLNERQRSELEKGYKNGKSHAFRERYKMMLLKSEKRTSAKIARFLDCHKMMRWFNFSREKTLCKMRG